MDAFQAARSFQAAARMSPNAIELRLPDIPLMQPARALETVAGLVESTIRLALTYLAGVVGDKVPHDTGHLAQSFAADPATSTGGIELIGAKVGSEAIFGRVFSSLPYAIVMDQGRRAGAPIGREGIEAIGLWAQRKLGLSAEEAAHAKFAIAKSIMAHGIEAHEFIEAALAAGGPRVQVMFEQLSTQLRIALTDGRAGVGAWHR